MEVRRFLCLSTIVVVLVCATIAEAGISRRYDHHRSRKYGQEEPIVSQVQVQQEDPNPIEIEPAQSQEASTGSQEKSHLRQRKAPILCNANTAASTLGESDRQKTPHSSFEVINSQSAESIEMLSSEEEEMVEAPVSQPKPVKNQRGQVVETSFEEDESVDEDEEYDDSSSNFSTTLGSLEQPETPQALSNEEIPEDVSRAVEGEEEMPKARKSKHNRKEVRRIERPHRRRVVYHFSEEDDE